MWQKLLWIALGGACGTLARYGLGGAIQRLLGPGFPWGTAAVNIIGCFLCGIVWVLAIERGNFSPEMRTALLVGFMGAFTTFSTFVSETGQLLADAELLIGLGNVAFQVVAGTGIFFFGAALGRIL